MESIDFWSQHKSIDVGLDIRHYKLAKLKEQNY